MAQKGLTCEQIKNITADYESSQFYKGIEYKDYFIRKLKKGSVAHFVIGEHAAKYSFQKYLQHCNELFGVHYSPQALVCFQNKEYFSNKTAHLYKEAWSRLVQSDLSRLCLKNTQINCDNNLRFYMDPGEIMEHISQTKAKEKGLAGKYLFLTLLHYFDLFAGDEYSCWICKRCSKLNFVKVFANTQSD